jgi:hypothetical protein
MNYRRPSEAEIEAAAKALVAEMIGTEAAWQTCSAGAKATYLRAARIALEAAAKVGESEDGTIKTNCSA